MRQKLTLGRFVLGGGPAPRGLRWGLWLLGLTLVAWTTPAWALTVSGAVTDQWGGAVTGAEVSFVPDGGSVSAATDTTDATGHYSVGIDAGTYDVEVTPPASSVLLRQTLDAQAFATDRTLDIVLVNGAAEAYEVTLLDGSGDPIELKVSDSGAGGAGGAGGASYHALRARPNGTPPRRA